MQEGTGEITTTGGSAGPALPYVLESLLGGSGGTEVWVARSVDGVERVALKLIRDADRTPLALLQRGLQAAQSLDHPAIARVIDFGESARGLYVASRLVEPHFTLAELVARQHKLRVPLSPAIVAHIGVTIADALDAATRASVDGVATPLEHLHLSGSNVLLDREGRVFLADLAVPASRTAISPVGGASVRGTPGYLAPEQVRGEGPLTHADVFVLGALLHECATLTPLFARPDPNASMRAILEHPIDALSDRVSGFPVALSRVIARALSRTPSDRYASAAELRGALKECATSIPGFADAKSALAGHVEASERAPDARTEELTGEVDPSLEEPTGAMLSPPIAFEPKGSAPAETGRLESIEERAPPSARARAGAAPASLAELASSEVASEPRVSALAERPPSASPREPTQVEGGAKVRATIGALLDEPRHRTILAIVFGIVIVGLTLVLALGGPDASKDAELKALYARGDYRGVEAYFRANARELSDPSAAFDLAADAWRRQRTPAPTPQPTMAAPKAPTHGAFAAIVVPSNIPEPVAKTKAERKARSKAKKALAGGIRFLETGDVVMAERSLRRSIVALDSPAARIHLALLHARAGELDEAASNLERYLELWPEAPDAERLRELASAVSPDSGRDP